MSDSSSSQPSLEEAIVVLKLLQKDIEENGANRSNVAKYLMVKKFVEDEIKKRKAMALLGMILNLGNSSDDTSKMSNDELKSVSEEATSGGGIAGLLNALGVLFESDKESEKRETTGNKLKRLRDKYNEIDKK